MGISATPGSGFRHNPPEENKINGLRYYLPIQAVV
jgi:hypothetical protein